MKSVEKENRNSIVTIKVPENSIIRGHRSKLYLFDDIDPELIDSINACIKEFEVKKEEKLSLQKKEKDDMESLYFLSSCEN